MSNSLYVKINERDNVAIAPHEIAAGTDIGGVIAQQDIPQAHKVTLTDVPAGGAIVRSGVTLGYALEDSPAERTIADVGAKLFGTLIDCVSDRSRSFAEQHGLANGLCIFNPAPIT